MIKLIGNPFVDTGKRIISYLVKKPVDRLSAEDIRDCIFYKKIGGFSFVELLPKLKSFNLVFLNHPLDPKYKNPTEYFLEIIDGLINNFKDNENNHDCVCNICGSSFKNRMPEIMATAQKMLKKTADKDTKYVWIGRNLFPLVGSMANDSQTFPQAIHDIKICPVCLLSVQFLPLLSIKYRGKLILFNATNPNIIQTLINSFLDELFKRFEISNSEKINLDEVSIESILNYIPRSEKPVHFSLIFHLYSNFAAKADYEKKVLPAQFIENVIKLQRISSSSFHFCMNYCTTSKKRSSNFFDIIFEEKETYALYEAENIELSFFDLFLIKILKYDAAILNGFKQIAHFLIEIEDKEDKKLLSQSSLKNSYKDFWIIIKKIVKIKADQQLWNSAQHLTLFKNKETFSLHYRDQFARIIHFYYKKLISGESVRTTDFHFNETYPEEYFIIHNTVKHLTLVDNAVLKQSIKNNNSLFKDYEKIVYQDDYFYRHLDDLLFLLYLDKKKDLDEQLYTDFLPEASSSISDDLYLIASAYISFYKEEKGKSMAEIEKMIIMPYKSHEMPIAVFISILNLLIEKERIEWELGEFIKTRNNKREIVFIWFNYLYMLLKNEKGDKK